MGAIVNGLVLQRLPRVRRDVPDLQRLHAAAIRLAALMRIPSIFVFTHDSIGLGEDGPTHQPIEQLAPCARRRTSTSCGPPAPTRPRWRGATPRERRTARRCWRESASAVGVSVARAAKRQASAVSLKPAGRTTLRFGVARSVGELLDRLVGRAVLAHADRVVGEHEGRRDAHDRGEPERRLHVVAEDEEAGAERAEAAAARGR